MPPRWEFRPPKSKEEEKNTLEECIPESTRSSTKWSFKVFSEWQIGRANKDPSKEQRSFEIDIGKVQSLDTNIANMNVESLNFWLTKMLNRDLYSITAHFISISRPSQL